MKLMVEILTGRFFHVEVGEEATVKDLKKAIAEQEAVLQEQRMIFMLGNGRVLKDDQHVLSQYEVLDGSLLYLFFTSNGNPNWVTFFEDFVTFFVRER